MKLRRWFALRGPEFIRKRAAVLLKRYGVTPIKAQARIQRTMALLTRYGCMPTFPTPGRVTQDNIRFIRQIQDSGAEIAVHSYDHVDLRGYPPDEASQQLIKAVGTFERFGIEVHGFRCPYLSYSDELMRALPKGLFKYSSNMAIGWNAILPTNGSTAGTVFNTINEFYQPQNALDAICMPRTHLGTVEIPVCVPDDLQLHDGLHLGPEGIAEAWCQILHQIYRRGELFTLVFHPEAADDCESGFAALLQETGRFRPPVWIARLRDIADWWLEKADFRSQVSTKSTELHISFVTSPRATLLVKGLDGYGTQEAWDGSYNRLHAETLDVPGLPRPLVGIASGVPAPVAAFLQEQGYILDTGEMAPHCAIYLDPTTLAGLKTQVELVNYIEKSTGPLVRYGRWPNGAKAALCITGDLDALSLLDYGSRLFIR